MPDYLINNGQGFEATGSVAATLLNNGMSPLALKPWVNTRNGKCYMAVNTGRFYPEGHKHAGKSILKAVQIGQNAATLRKDDWEHFDRAIMKIAKPRMKVFGNMRSAGMTYTVPNAMAKPIMSWERMSDITGATISMDGLRQSEIDRPTFDMLSMPLPIIHKDFNISARELAASRTGGTPLDTASAELAARRVAEEVEKMTLGTASSYAFGGGTIYGFTNFPQRLTKVLSAPGTPATTRDEIVDMIKQAMDNFHYGPFDVYYSTGFMTTFAKRYSTYEAKDLKQIVSELDLIENVMMADYLTGNQIILVERDTTVARAVIGQEIQTLQWESHAGMQLNFKVLCILHPQIRADQDGNTGIVHGATA